MRFHVDPEQIQALNAGEEITVMVRMEPQPPSDARFIHVERMAGAVFIYYGHRIEIARPLAVGTTVEVVCRACGGSSMSGALGRQNRVNVNTCGACNGESVWLRIVASIAHRETDGVHYWDVEVRQ